MTAQLSKNELELRLSSMRAQLADLIADAGLPVGIIWQGNHGEIAPAMFVLADENVSRHPIDSMRDQKHQKLRDLPLTELASLVEYGVRGAKLSTEMSIRRQAAPHNGDVLVKEVTDALAACSSGNSDFGSQIDDEFKVVAEQDKKAKDAGQLVGRIITEPVADGRAYYLIAEQKGNQVRVAALPVCDRYTTSYFGNGRWIDMQHAIENIRRADAMADLVARNSKGPRPA